MPGAAGRVENLPSQEVALVVIGDTGLTPGAQARPRRAVLRGEPGCPGRALGVDGGLRVEAKRVMSRWSPSAPPPPPGLRAVSENGANGAGRSCPHRGEGLRGGGGRCGWWRGSCSLAPPWPPSAERAGLLTRHRRVLGCWGAGGRLGYPCCLPEDQIQVFSLPRFW